MGCLAFLDPPHQPFQQRQQLRSVLFPSRALPPPSVVECVHWSPGRPATCIPPESASSPLPPLSLSITSCPMRQPARRPRSSASSIEPPQVTRELTVSQIFWAVLAMTGPTSGHRDGDVEAKAPNHDYYIRRGVEAAPVIKTGRHRTPDLFRRSERSRRRSEFPETGPFPAGIGSRPAGRFADNARSHAVRERANTDSISRA